MDNQRELAHKFGPPSVAFQDFVGVQVRSGFVIFAACQATFSTISGSALYCPQYMTHFRFAVCVYWSGRQGGILGVRKGCYASVLTAEHLQSCHQQGPVQVTHW
jgi:hypothetical protein